MSIMIAPTAALDALTLSGDLTRTIPLPMERSSGSLFIAASDGTLLEASFSQASEGRFKVIHEGAGVVLISGGAAEVQWPIEWLTVSGTKQAMTIERLPEPLPLFPEAA